jgi:hypothetical protein
MYPRVAALRVGTKTVPTLRAVLVCVLRLVDALEVGAVALDWCGVVFFLRLFRVVAGD